MIDYLHLASWASWLLHEPNPDTPSVQDVFFDIVRIYIILCYVIVLGFLFSSSSLLSSPLLLCF